MSKDLTIPKMFVGRCIVKEFVRGLIKHLNKDVFNFVNRGLVYENYIRRQRELCLTSLRKGLNITFSTSCFWHLIVQFKTRSLVGAPMHAWILDKGKLIETSETYKDAYFSYFWKRKLFGNENMSNALQFVKL